MSDQHFPPNILVSFVFFDFPNIVAHYIEDFVLVTYEVSNRQIWELFGAFDHTLAIEFRIISTLFELSM